MCLMFLGSGPVAAFVAGPAVAARGASFTSVAISNHVAVRSFARAPGCAETNDFLLVTNREKKVAPLLAARDPMAMTSGTKKTAIITGASSGEPPAYFKQQKGSHVYRSPR